MKTKIKILHFDGVKETNELGTYLECYPHRKVYQNEGLPSFSGSGKS